MPATDPTVRLSCPAKVNLALSVAPAQPDGYHPIASWMVALCFCDALTLAKADSSESHFDIRFADDAPLPQPIDWPLEKDLACRAHQLLANHAGQQLPIDATINKRIPAGAGLGGGSSDAAAMLVGLNKLFDLDVPQHELHQLAGRLGCDVAFGVSALLGQPAAVATHLGEVLEPTRRSDVLHLVLVLPPFSCPTGQVYAAFDECNSGENAADEKRIRELVAQTPLLPDAPFNDLTEAACKVQPRLAMALQQLHQEMNLPVHVTGSGAAMFILAPSANTCAALARKVTGLTGLPAIATRTLA